MHVRTYVCNCTGPLLIVASNDSMPVRLVNGSWAGEGRLEVKVSAAWGTICDSGFSSRAANVACRQLGYFGASAVLDDSYFGSGVVQSLVEGRGGGRMEHQRNCTYQVATPFPLLLSYSSTSISLLFPFQLPLPLSLLFPFQFPLPLSQWHMPCIVVVSRVTNSLCISPWQLTD